MEPIRVKSINDILNEKLEMRKVLNVRITAERSFIAGTWAEKNKATSKAMCLRDKLKECNLCHECDVSVLNPSY